MMFRYLLSVNSQPEIGPRTILRCKIYSHGIYKFQEWASGVLWIKRYGHPKSTNPVTDCTNGQLVDHQNHSKQNARSTMASRLNLTLLVMG